MTTVEEAKQALLEFTNYIKSVETVGNTIIVKPTGYIKDKGMWQAITNIVASLGGKYVPERDNNTWQLPLSTVQNEPSKFTPSDPLAVTKHIDNICLDLEKALKLNNDSSQTLAIIVDGAYKQLETLKKEVDEMLKH